MPEKRKFVRFSANIKVEWTIPSPFPPPAKGVTDKIKDLSRGGVCLHVDKKLNTGKIIQLKINLPTGKEVNLKGKIVRVSDLTQSLKEQPVYEIGIEFQEMDNDDRETLEKFIFEELSPR